MSCIFALPLHFKATRVPAKKTEAYSTFGLLQG